MSRCLRPCFVLTADSQLEYFIWIASFSGPVFLIPLVACLVGLAAVLLAVLCICTRKYRKKDPLKGQQNVGYFTKTRNTLYPKHSDKNVSNEERDIIPKIAKTNSSSPTELTDLEGVTSSSSPSPSFSPEPGDELERELNDNRILASIRAAKYVQKEVEKTLQKPDTVNHKLHRNSTHVEILVWKNGCRWIRLFAYLSIVLPLPWQLSYSHSKISLLELQYSSPCQHSVGRWTLTKCNDEYIQYWNNGLSESIRWARFYGYFTSSQQC